MSSDTAGTGTFQVKIPTALMTELRINRVPRPSSLKVDGFKPSLLDRLFGRLDDGQDRNQARKR